MRSGGPFDRREVLKHDMRWQLARLVPFDQIPDQRVLAAVMQRAQGEQGLRRIATEFDRVTVMFVEPAAAGCEAGAVVRLEVAPGARCVECPNCHATRMACAVARLTMPVTAR